MFYGAATAIILPGGCGFSFNLSFCEREQFWRDDEPMDEHRQLRMDGDDELVGSRAAEHQLRLHPGHEHGHENGDD